MSLVVGTNSYITVQEADELIAQNFMSTDPIRVFWGNISEDSDKESLILNSTKKYDRDSMCYKWFKQDPDQPLQFPRIDIYKQIIECPEDIKLGLLVQGIKTNMMNQYSEYQQLKAQGIRQFADGSGAKIEFFDSFDVRSIDTSVMDTGMYKLVFNQYFKDYVDLL